MCASCFTKLDAVALNSAGVLAMAAASRRRLLDAWHGRSPMARRRAAYDDAARFLAGLGHDPSTVLGPAPERREPAAATRG